MSINQVTLDGNLATDPHLEALKSGTAKTSFLLAHNRYYTERTTGDQKEDTQYFWVESYGKIAVNANEFLVKGQEITLTGSVTGGVIKMADGTYKNCTNIKADYIKYGNKPKPKDATPGSGATAVKAPVTTNTDEEGVF